MEPQLTLTVEGQEARQDELNLVAENAALADDRILAELVRLSPGTGTVSKGIIPHGLRRLTFLQNDALTLTHQVVASSGSSNSTVRVPPIRAVIGPRTFDASASMRDRIRGIRSALVLPDDEASAPYTNLVLDATVSDSRWDLVYLRVTLDETVGQVRYVKSFNGPVAPQSLDASKRTTATLLVAKGIEAASPSRPALPSDDSSSGIYYIPLAYVGLAHPHTSSTKVSNSRIDIVAPIVGVIHAAGGINAGPANHLFAEGGSIKTQSPWTISSRPDAYLPPDMVGEVVRHIPLNLSNSSGNLSVPLGVSTVLDDSIDWRYRLIQGWYYAGGGTATFPWAGSGGVPSAVAHSAFVLRLAQTFKADGGLGSNEAALAILFASPVPVGLVSMAVGAQVAFYVNMTDGRLYIRVTNNPACMMYAIIRASGPFRTGLE